MVLYNQARPEFQKHGAELLGVSVDDVWCHNALPNRTTCILLLADFEPTGAVAADPHSAIRPADVHRPVLSRSRV